MLTRIDFGRASWIRFAAVWLSFAVALPWLPAAGFARTTFEIVRRSKPLLIIGQPSDPEKAGFHRIAFSPNGRNVLAIRGDGMLRVWDSITGKEIRHAQLPMASEAVFSRDAQRLALHDCYRADGFLRVHDTASGKEVFRSQHRWQEEVGCPAISPDGRLIACRLGELGRTIKIWDIASGRWLQTLEQRVTREWTMRDAIRTLDFSSDGKCLAVAFSNGLVTVWEVASGKPIFSRDIYFKPGSRTALPLRNERMTQTTPFVWSVPWLTFIQTWDMAIADCRATFSPNGRQLAWVGSDHDQVRLLDAANGAEQARLTAGKLFAFSPEGKRLAIATTSDRTVGTPKAKSGKLIILDLARKRPSVEVAAGFDETIEDTTFSPDGRCVASAHQDGTIKVWDVSVDR
jgi:WD40 repeat protein